MGMVVRTNTMSSNAYRQLGMNNSALAKSLEKLSSGYRINRAGDDASGLAISEKMKSQIAGLEQASSNSQDGISLVQTAEGALTEVHSMLNRMVELATKSANGTIQDNVDRDSIQSEVDALKDEITRVSKSTTFNGIQLLDGSLGGAAAVTTTAGTTGAATAGTFEIDLSGAGAIESGKTYKLSIGSDDVAESAATAGTATTDLATAFNGKTVTISGRTYTAVASGTKLTFTDNATGASTAVSGTVTLAKGTTQAPSGAPSGSPTIANAVAGVAAGTATGPKVTLDYTNATGAKVLGTTVKIGSKTYEFVKSGDAVKTSGATAVTVADTDAGSAIATALKTAMGTDFNADYTVGSSGAQISLTTKVATGKAISVEQKGTGLTLQIGTTSDDFNMVAVSVEDLSAKGLGIDNLDVSTAEAARKSIQTINDAINKVSTNRGNLGALQNRLEHAISNLDTTAENMDSANSAIRDTDMAKEMMNYTKMNILSQAAQAMLAQANQQPQNILQLLK